MEHQIGVPEIGRKEKGPALQRAPDFGSGGARFVSKPSLKTVNVDVDASSNTNNGTRLIKAVGVPVEEPPPHFAFCHPRRLSDNLFDRPQLRVVDATISLVHRSLVRFGKEKKKERAARPATTERVAIKAYSRNGPKRQGCFRIALDRHPAMVRQTQRTAFLIGQTCRLPPTGCLSCADRTQMRGARHGRLHRNVAHSAVWGSGFRERLLLFGERIAGRRHRGGGLKAVERSGPALSLSVPKVCQKR